VAALSLLPVFAFPYAFGRALDRATRVASSGVRALALFVAALLALPLLLIALF
jgi:hypothetical protein